MWIVAMTVRVLLRPDKPASIQLKISPIVAAMTGLRFSGRWVVGDPGGCSTAGPWVPSSVVHSTPFRSPEPVGGPGVESVCRPRGRRQREQVSSPRAVPPFMRLLGRVAPCPGPSDEGRPETHRPGLREVLEADLRHRFTRLAAAGIPGLFADLHPGVRLDGDVLHVDTGCDTEISSGCVVLMPSVRCERLVLLVAEPPNPLLLLYPARSAGRPEAVTASTAASGLGRAVGEGLPLLLDLHEPRTVDELAGRHDMHPQCARQHLATLTSAGLLAPCAEYPARYERTSLAGLLCSPWCDRCS
jgi:hypothetical protein